MGDVTKIIEGEVLEVLSLEKSLKETEDELSKNVLFRNFIELQKKTSAQITETWKKLEEQMIEHDVKSIKGDWGSLTIAERQGWTIAEELLPKKFFKKVVDTKRITDTYRLEGKPIAGAEPYTTKYLVKRIK